MNIFNSLLHKSLYILGILKCLYKLLKAPAVSAYKMPIEICDYKCLVKSHIISAHKNLFIAERLKYNRIP